MTTSKSQDLTATSPDRSIRSTMEAWSINCLRSV